MSRRELPGVTIRDAEPFDEAGWRPLWAGYVAFHNAEVPERITARTWERILDPASPVNCMVAVDALTEHVLGFAVTVLHDGTWTDRPVCYLEDLFVADHARNRGIARALIETIACRGRSRGWRRVYWKTKSDNATARALYERVGREMPAVFYEIDL